MSVSPDTLIEDLSATYSRFPPLPPAFVLL